MPRLTYAMGSSLDGYAIDAEGRFEFTEPDEEVHRRANAQAIEAVAFVFGRRLYETMEPFWPEAARDPSTPPLYAEFARAYVATPRVIVSDSLDAVGDGCRLVRRADARAEVERLKAAPGEGEIHVGGPTLAAALIDLVDEICTWVAPVAAGGGTPLLPAGVRLDLELLECRRTVTGYLWLRYANRGSARPDAA